MIRRLLLAGRLFQALLKRDLPRGFEVASDLDVDSFDEIPFVTHSTVIAQRPGDAGLWEVTLTINLFLDPADADLRAADVYEVVHAWGDDPGFAIVPDVGAVETVEDLNAFAPMSGEVLMNNKAMRHYQATFNIVARVHPY